jgi:hypothetical protein
VVGQVEQQQPAEVLLALVQGAGPGVAVPPLDAEPVEQRPRPGHPPHARVRLTGRRPGDAHRRELRPGEHVEQRGLAASGAAGQGHDGVRTGQPQPFPGPAEQVGRLVEQVAVETVRPTARRADLHQPGQRVQSAGQAGGRGSSGVGGADEVVETRLACPGAGESGHLTTSSEYVAW